MFDLTSYLIGKASGGTPTPSPTPAVGIALGIVPTSGTNYIFKISGHDGATQVYCKFSNTLIENPNVGDSITALWMPAQVAAGSFAIQVAPGAACICAVTVDENNKILKSGLILL